jgi:signal transduction histidine kinase
MLLRRAAQVAITCVVFAVFNTIGGWFEIANGVSILYPAAAVAILACMIFGPWAALGVVLGTILTPWVPESDVQRQAISGAVVACEGLIPWLVFRWRRDLSPDLRDMRSFLAFLFFGTILNSAATAVAGNLLVIAEPLQWHNVFVWFISDFTAALLIATPVLAFGGTLLDVESARRTGRVPPRMLTNSLQIVTVILVLGFGASFAIRTYLFIAHSKPGALFGVTRQKVLLVSAIVDGMVFIILVTAALMLLYTISRPLAQLRGAIRAMRDGEPLHAARIDDRYLEMQSIAQALEEASLALRRREEELRLQTQKAVQASQHKSEFLAKMSHELRTPLNAIIGFSDLMAEQEESITREKRLSFLENVATSARHLLKLINDLLDIAKVESGKMKLNLSTIDLRMTIANTVASVQPLFVRRRQEVEVDTPAEPMLARADPGRVEQVLLNLLSNANKFSAEGQTITVRGCGDDRMWRIEVIDRGIGISADDQARIFNEFEQGSDAVAAAAGTGLGLALVKRFIEAHGGTVSVESELGSGSVFRVTLPRD